MSTARRSRSSARSDCRSSAILSSRHRSSRVCAARSMSATRSQAPSCSRLTLSAARRTSWWSMSSTEGGSSLELTDSTTDSSSPAAHSSFSSPADPATRPVSSRSRGFHFCTSARDTALARSSSTRSRARSSAARSSGVPTTGLARPRRSARYTAATSFPNTSPPLAQGDDHRARASRASSMASSRRCLCRSSDSARRSASSWGESGSHPTRTHSLAMDHSPCPWALKARTLNVYAPGLLRPRSGVTTRRWLMRASPSAPRTVTKSPMPCLSRCRIWTR
mmetsp:Transcript_72373/g.228121  ORF Transcript_72373/g.228121 Transcript_72373/m.228121 type:complete len:279 (+) Transcript_72373:448-1284(+)